MTHCVVPISALIGMAGSCAKPKMRSSSRQNSKSSTSPKTTTPNSTSRPSSPRLPAHLNFKVFRESVWRASSCTQSALAPACISAPKFWSTENLQQHRIDSEIYAKPPLLHHNSLRMSSADQIASAALQQLLVRRRRRAGKPVPARIETAEGRVEKAARRKKVKVDTSVDKELAYRMSVKALKKDTKKFDEAIETRKKVSRSILSLWGTANGFIRFLTSSRAKRRPSAKILTTMIARAIRLHSPKAILFKLLDLRRSNRHASYYDLSAILRLIKACS